MAHKKGQGSTENGRDSKSKRLGVKLFGGQVARAGNIVVRQRGTKYHAGENAYLGKDYTIHAAVDGRVQFRRGYKDRVFVNIVQDVAETAAPLAPAKPAAPAAVQAPKVVPKAAPVVEVEVQEEQPVAESAAKKPKASTKKGDSGQDDLKKVEGIGPKIEGLLNDAGIVTFAQLASADEGKLREILEAAGSRYKMHDPATWTKQASLAADGKWEELKQLQEELKGGKEA